MTARDVLSPAMIGTLQQIGRGEHLDGRSWRALTALERRGLVEHVGGAPALTAAGTAALATLASPASPADEA